MPLISDARCRAVKYLTDILRDIETEARKAETAKDPVLANDFRAIANATRSAALAHLDPTQKPSHSQPDGEACHD